MKDLSLATLIAVFEEMFGPTVFWLLVAIAVIGFAAFVYVLVRQGRIRSAPFLRAELIGMVGGVVAVLFVQWITDSSFGDIGGPIDMIVLALIWTVGAVGTAIVSYTIQGLLRPSP